MIRKQHTEASETGKTYFAPGDQLPTKDSPEADILDGIEGWLVCAFHEIPRENYKEGRVDPQNSRVKKSISALKQEMLTEESPSTRTKLYVLLDTSTRKAI